MGNELRSTGVVVELRGSKALVVFKRMKACGDCRACASFGENEACIEIENTLNAEIGDRVEISLHSSSVLEAILIMYGIPLIALLAGVYVGCMFSDLVGAVIGISAALLSLLAIHIFEPRFKKSGKFDPRMLSIINNE